ncbi:hypothetical protein UlMin_010046 [Ulmus minor]
MGCFLACFGVSKKRKRRKAAHKILAAGLRHGSYLPLDSSTAIAGLGSEENPSKAESEPKQKLKEQKSLKIRKKVRFNLNVQIYEPISTAYHILEGEEEEKMEKNGKETAERSLSTSRSVKGVGINAGSFNLNYRYQNCRDWYDEEDDIAFGDSDLDDDDEGEEDYDWESDIDNHGIIRDGISEKSCSGEAVEEKDNLSTIDNGHNSVLKPVENLSQWRAAKAKAAPDKQQSKENIALIQESQLPFTSKQSSAKAHCNHSRPLLQEIAVNSSFSSWLNTASTLSV